MRNIEEIENTKISHSCEDLIESYVLLRSLGFELTINNFFRPLFAEQPPATRDSTDKIMDLVTTNNSIDLPRPRYFRQVDIYTTHDYEQALKDYEQFFDCQYRAIQFVHHYFSDFVMQHLREMGKTFHMGDQHGLMSKDMVRYAIRRKWLIRFADQFVFSPKLRILISKREAYYIHEALTSYLNERQLDSYERQTCLGIWVTNVKAGLIPLTEVVG